MFHVKHRLLADAKPAENLIQHIHLDRCAEDLPQCIDSILQLYRYQFHGVAIIKFVTDSERGFKAIFQQQLLPEVRDDSGFDVNGIFAKSRGNNLLFKRFSSTVMQG